ncbi:hypothetical protein B9Z19DRAFT_1126917 [Tuber borchii]|uniref:Uncharacterized protein n=1 Tax=Tuber borchii TaxID=42251 RepID=A0A2T6ZS96_TUBBO|nr:hypothetical protein B9Z19DRAFT_1126917 [Tuber borchii]
MVTLTHELAHTVFTRCFEDEIAKMGLGGRALECTGAARYGPKRAAGEADCGYKPMPARRLNNDWPTLIVEAGVSQRLESLQEDAEWWLETSKGGVGTVILIFASRQARLLQFQKWEVKEVVNPQVTRNRNWESERFVQCTGNVEIVGDTATGDEIEISFEKIFLRAPEKDDGESNITFTHDALIEIADRVWEGTSSPSRSPS